MNRNIIIAAIAAVAIILASWVFAGGLKRKPAGEYINVTGMSQVDFNSDLIIWTADFNRTSYELKDAYQQLKSDQQQVEKFLKSSGIKDTELIIGTINIEKQFDYTQENGSSKRVFLGYRVSQYIKVKSTNVAEVERIAKESMALIEQGIEFNSRSPEFYYTKLSDLKLNLIEKATTDAKNRAEKIAISAGSKLGKLKKSNLGVFQITAQNDNEDYSWGGVFNTSSKLKTARVTVSVSYSPE